MANVLVIFAHTFYEDSKVNKALLESIKSKPNITIHNLSTRYKDNKIDIDFELSLLKKADKIVFQFPLFWFSTPSILKEWQDRVLTHIIYSENANLLANKSFQIITSAGGAKSSYEKVSLDELLQPINQSFLYCKARCLKPFAIYSANAANLDFALYQKMLEEI